MNHYKNLINYVDSLIYSKAAHDSDGYSLSLDMLDDDEKSKLCALFIEKDDRDATECFYENKPCTDDNIMSALINMLHKNSYESKEELADVIRKNSISLYSERMQELLDERCNEREAEELFENRMMRVIDRNYGDSIIVRM